MKFIFWNIKNKSLVKEISELIIETECDIIAFAEMDHVTGCEIQQKLTDDNGIKCSLFPTPGCDRITILIIGETDQIFLLNQHKYYSLIKVNDHGYDIIVGFVHFPSKINHSLDELRRTSEILCNQISKEEDAISSSRSLIIGDFNVDPFEMPMISFTGMSATNGVNCSLRKVITRGGEKSKLFYNPMWTLYSTYKERPGSHKYSRLGEDVVSWHFLDQVIIRPELIDNFRFDSLKLINGTANYSYTNRNESPKISDHLPLMCELEFIGRLP